MTWRRLFWKTTNDLPAECKHTYRRHLGHSVLDAATAGILANAPLMAIKGMGSPDWQMSLQLAISSIGMFAVLYLGGYMARRPKKPFVLVPGFAHALAAFCMAWVSDVLVFLVLLGVSTLCEVFVRPAVTAIIRFNYPATHRGAATGEIRRWCAIAFVTTSLISATLLDIAVLSSGLMIRVQLLVAAGLAVASYLTFRTIRVKEPDHEASDGLAQGHIAKIVQILREDRRFRRYILIGFLFTLGTFTYVSFVPLFFVRRLNFGYLEASVLTHVLPSLVAFLLTGALGRWIDRINPWKAWAWIRAGWGADPLLLGVGAIALGTFSPLAVLLSFAARISRGSVMGGAWILWWQLGVNYFSKPSGQTTRYMSVVILVDGICRLIGPFLGVMILTYGSYVPLFMVGAGLVMLAMMFSAFEYGREKKFKRYQSFSHFEGYDGSTEDSGEWAIRKRAG